MVDDNFILQPTTSYGVEKVIGELLLNDYSRRAAEQSLKATRQQEVDCAALKEKEDRDWATAKDVVMKMTLPRPSLPRTTSQAEDAPSPPTEGADSESSKK